MSGPHGSTKEIDHQERLKVHETHAMELCSMALETADELFEHGNLTPYLTVLSRLHHLNFYNLLLVLRQYPSATHLGSFRNWQKVMKQQAPEKTMVLKRDQFGKGIELIAPFTNFQPEGTLSLTWHSLLQFDITQTNIRNYEPARNIYASNPRLVHDLIRALLGVLSEEHCATIFIDTSSNPYSSGTPGYMKGNEIHCHPDLSAPDLLTWLAQCLLTLSHPEQVVGKRYQHLFLQMAQHCLFQIWGIAALHLPQNAGLIRSVPKDLRPVFLDLLQRRVRHTEETIYSQYQSLLNEREEEAISNIPPAFPISE